MQVPQEHRSPSSPGPGGQSAGRKGAEGMSRVVARLCREPGSSRLGRGRGRHPSHGAQPQSPAQGQPHLLRPGARASQFPLRAFIYLHSYSGDRCCNQHTIVFRCLSQHLRRDWYLWSSRLSKSFHWSPCCGVALSRSASCTVTSRGC